MKRNLWVYCILVSIMPFAGGCSDRGEMHSQQSSADAIDVAAGTTPVTVTGCFQEFTGFDNFVLSNIGDAPGVDPAATRSFRIEQSGDLEQYVGKRVTISGSVDEPKAAEGMMAKRTNAGELDFNDLPELHVESVTPLSEACGGPKP